MVGPDNRQGLLLTSDTLLDVQTVHAAMEHFSMPRTSLIATASTSSSLSGLPKAAFDTVVSLSSAPGHHDVPFLGLLLAALRAGGKLTIEQLSGEGKAGLEKSLLLSGFTQIATQPASALLGAGASVTAVSATKPEWETGAKAAVSKLGGGRRAQQPAVHASPPAPAASVWLMAPDEEEELVDEEELLTEADRARPDVPTVGECEAGAAKKACANCSCGRAEEEAAGVKAALTPDMLDNPQSACGSCGLGDAFRCSTCPYRGLPKFEMGEKVQLPSDFLTADA